MYKIYNIYWGKVIKRSPQSKNSGDDKLEETQK
jgi:hypothetical protein